MEYKLKSGKTLKVIQDEDAQNPRDWKKMSKMICFHKGYNLGDKHDYRFHDYRSWEQMKRAIVRKENPVAVRPLYLLDHSGITMRTHPFSCRWDSGQVGWIIISRDMLSENYPDVKRVSAKFRAKLETMLDAEVKTYDQFISGEVYGFNVLDEEGTELDSCWGFYGSDPKENGMLEQCGEELLAD